MSDTWDFLGYQRSDGRVGVRNHLLIIPSVICSNRVVDQVAEAAPGAIALQHQHGCSQIGDDIGRTFQTLAGFGKNPNVGAVLIVSLGCETLDADRLAEDIATTGKPVEFVRIQDVGGTVKTIDAGRRVASQLHDKLAQQERTPCSLREVVVAAECEGNDPAAIRPGNEGVGRVIERLVADGGKAVFSEVPELLAAEEEILVKAREAGLDPSIRSLFAAWRKHVVEAGAGALLNNGRERALASLSKTGTAPIHWNLEYAERVGNRGLSLMDTPEHSAESVTGMVSGGAQVVLFTTAAGVPTGSPIAPVIKISSNQQAIEGMRDHIDVDLTDRTDSEAAVVEMLKAVSGGRETAAEILGYQDFAINRIGPTV